MIKDEQNKNEEFGEVAELLGRLKKVEAPPDFDFRVRARIANGKPASRGLFGIPAAARYATALAVLLVGGGAVGYYVLNIGDGELAVAPVTSYVETQQPVVNAQPDPGGTAIDPVLPDQKPDSGSIAGLPRNRETGSGNRVIVNTQNPGGGSSESGYGETKRLYPKGIDPNPIKPIRPGEFPTGSRIPVKDVISMLGVNVKPDGTALTIESVIESSKAARAGLRPGDIIDAINDQKVSSTSSIKGPFIVKKVRVMRDGQPVSVLMSDQ